MTNETTTTPAPTTFQSEIAKAATMAKKSVNEANKGSGNAAVVLIDLLQNAQTRPNMLPSNDRLRDLIVAKLDKKEANTASKNMLAVFDAFTDAVNAQKAAAKKNKAGIGDANDLASNAEKAKKHVAAVKAMIKRSIGAALFFLEEEKAGRSKGNYAVTDAGVTFDAPLSEKDKTKTRRTTVSVTIANDRLRQRHNEKKKSTNAANNAASIDKLDTAELFKGASRRIAKLDTAKGETKEELLAIHALICDMFTDEDFLAYKKENAA